MASSKYYICREIDGEITYKRYKCIEGWTTDKSLCWAFSKQGALGIIETQMKIDKRFNRKAYYKLERAI